MLVLGHQESFVSVLVVYSCEIAHSSLGLAILYQLVALLRLEACTLLLLPQWQLLLGAQVTVALLKLNCVLYDDLL